MTSGTKKHFKNWPQVAAILSGALTSFNGGLLYAWPSPFTLQIIEDKQTFDISENEAYYFIILPPLATMIFSIIVSSLCDRIGRKTTLLLVAIPHGLSWLLSAIAKNKGVFYMSRLMAGAGDGFAMACLPMYIGEIATPKVRGIWGNAVAGTYLLGELIINVIALCLSIRETSYVGIMVTLLFLTTFVFMPESPYYYMMKGNDEDAKKSLRKITRKENVESELAQLESDVKRQVSERGDWKDLVSIDSNRRALTAGLFLRLSQQLGGLPIIVTYTQYLFQKSGSDIDPDLSAIMYMSLTVALNILAAINTDKLGRKLAFITSLIPAGIVCLIMSTFFYIDENIPDFDLSTINWIPIIGMLLHAVFSSYGLNIIPSLMMGELFSASIKAKAMTVLLIALGCGSFLVTVIFQYLNSLAGLWAPFAFFGICNLISAVISIYVVPETKGKTLEDIQQDLKR